MTTSTHPRSARLVFVLAMAAVGVCLVAVPRTAHGEPTCGGQTTQSTCGVSNPFPCCYWSGMTGNCTWWAWERACRDWNQNLTPRGNANTWNENAGPNTVTSEACANTVFICEADSGTATAWPCTSGNFGHVGMVTGAYPNGDVDISEQGCYWFDGTRNRTFSASSVRSNFIHFLYPLGASSCGPRPACSVAVKRGVTTDIDDKTNCFSKSCRTGNYWWEEAYGHDNHHWYTYTVDDSSSDCTGTWEVNVDDADTYQVQVFVPNNTATVTQHVTYRVRHNGSEDTAVVDQAANRGSWVTLGSYAFGQGGDQWVRIEDNTGEAYTSTSGPRLLLDAVRFTTGGGCTDACSSGKRCVGNGWEECGNFDADSCLEWGGGATCAAGESCSAGQCLSSCTDECSGGKRCSGNGWQECGNYDGDSCLEWGGGASCSGGQMCSSGACVSSCSSLCSAGAKRCVGNGWQECVDTNNDGCLEWGGGSTCPADTYCSGAGTCVASSQPCADDCNSGIRCSASNVWQTCGNYDGDTCLEWGGDTACRAGSVCQEGVCIACVNSCEYVGQTGCRDSRYVATCQADTMGCLTWTDVADCASSGCNEPGVCVDAPPGCPGIADCTGLQCGADPICRVPCGLCPSSERCLDNMCVRGSDDTGVPDVFAGDAGVDASGGDGGGGPRIMAGGDCGCATVTSSGPGPWLGLCVAGLCLAWRRRRKAV